jgi:signal transduction histidine kinase
VVVTRPSFRARVLLYLFLFAVVPSSLLMLGGVALVSATLPRITGSGAWDSAAASGRRAITTLRRGPLTEEQRAVIDAHERELEASLTQARRFSYLASRAVPIVALLGLLGTAVLAVLASRVAGHLSRQLSRPLHEIVGWTELIADGRPLPEGPPPRGAPEFETLRTRMRRMAQELETARARQLEAGRHEAFRETARRVAHELKNPLTPIRFAVDRLRREVEPPLAEVVEVVASETRRLEEMARGFAQFGRLPEGPAADIDVGELARYAARATVPEHIPLSVHVAADAPMVRGHHDALARALSNVLLNAVEACRAGGGVEVGVQRAAHNGGEAVTLRVRDTGCGIPPAQLARIWEPYVTYKTGGTGLGLAIARQTVLAHGGAVDAVSAVGEGTEIRFVLPVAGAPASTEGQT